MTRTGDAVSKLRVEVCDANKDLANRGLARFTFGNASAIDRDAGVVLIKPSGVPYAAMTPADMVIVDLAGKIVEGTLRPSSDLATHLELYRAFEKIGGVVHTHSRYATLWAQSQREIPCFGTTHADYFHGSIPVTTHLKVQDIQAEYEANTGREIVRRFKGIDPLRMPAVLVAGHASFCWGETVRAAVEIADLLEEIAFMAYGTIALNAEAAPLPAELLEKHFMRKHGPAAYYGQGKAKG
ncbi:MAG: L-ribulose-5-phosphate 4-epimerase AraD [Gemmatimonadaceae bacterium]